jgi:hypothetical protein
MVAVLGWILLLLGIAAFIGGIWDATVAGFHTRSGIPFAPHLNPDARGHDDGPIPDKFLTPKGRRLQNRGLNLSMVGILVALFGWYLTNQ